MGCIYQKTWKDKKGEIHQSPIWWIKFYQNGRPHWESSESTKRSVAKSLLRTREGSVEKGELINPKAHKVTLGELAEDVYNDYLKRKYKTLGDIKRRFKKHLFPFFGEYMRASTLSTSRINQFIVHRQEQGASDGEINRELTALKRAYRLGFEAEPPRVMRMPTIKLLAEANPRQGFFEHGEFESVRSHLPDYLKGFITFSYLTGWRKNEVVNLQWAQVDLENEKVYLKAEDSKTKKSREFLFNDMYELKEVFQQQLENKEALKKRGIICPWVFNYRNGKQVGDFRKSWKEACKKAGLAGKIPHDLRRTAIRNFVRAGVSETVAMEISGHETRRVFDKYNVTSEEDRRQAARLLGAMVTKR